MVRLMAMNTASTTQRYLYRRKLLSSILCLFLLIQPVIDTLHLLVNLHEYREPLVVERAGFRRWCISAPELDQSRHIAEGNLTQPDGGDPRRAACVGLDGVLHLPDFDVHHVGENLAPHVRIAAPAGDVDCLHLAPHEFLKWVEQPARVEGYTLKKSADDIRPCVVQG